MIEPDFLKGLNTDDTEVSEDTSQLLGLTISTRSSSDRPPLHVRGYTDGISTFSNPTKRGKSTQKEANNRGGNSNQHTSSTSTMHVNDSNSDDDSNFTSVTSELSRMTLKKRDHDTVNSDDDVYVSNRKQSRKSDFILWDEISLAGDGSMSHLNQDDHEKMVEYRKAIEKLRSYFRCVDSLKLPANPLDHLINKVSANICSFS